MSRHLGLVFHASEFDSIFEEQALFFYLLGNGQIHRSIFLSPAKNPSRTKESSLYSSLARKVVSESLQLGKGETVTVETWNNGLPFATEVVKEARKIGSIPLLVLEDEEAYLYGVKNMPRDVLGSMGKHEYNLLYGSDAYVFIPGPMLGAYSPMLTHDESVASTAYGTSWYQAAEKAKLRGVRLSFGYVGKDLAKLLGKPAGDIAQHLIKASLVDFESLKKQGRQISESLLDGASSTLQTRGSKLEFKLSGDLTIEDGIADDADVSMRDNVSYVPPGMISKQVDSSSASGKVRLSPTVTRLGIVSDAILEFEGGRLTKWKSDVKRSNKMLNELVGTVAEDKRLLTNLIIGYNPSMKFGYSQDRFVSGAIGITGFGLTGIIRNGTLSVNGKSIVEKGKLKLV